MKKSILLTATLALSLISSSAFQMPALATQNFRLSEGIFKFKGRSPIYFSNGKGEYCWYKNWDDYVRLTGNPGWRIQGRKLIDYDSLYDGACVGGTGDSDASFPHPDPEFHELTLDQGIFKFEGRSPIYFSNGKGEYCWYKNWADYVRLTGNPGWRTQKGKLSRYIDQYDGACVGGTGSSDASFPHPDPYF